MQSPEKPLAEALELWFSDRGHRRQDRSLVWKVLKRELRARGYWKNRPRNLKGNIESLRKSGHASP